MRKLILGIVLALVVGTLVGQLMLSVPGYWLVRVGDVSFQTSFWFGIILLIALLLVINFVFGLLWRMRHPVASVCGWRLRSRQRRATRRTSQGLVSLGKGRWKRAERMLANTAEDAPTPLVNYLAAATAAHYQGHFDRAEQLLQEAGTRVPEAESAIGLVQAQLMMDRQQYEQSLATLTRLLKEHPEHPQVLKALMVCYRQVGDWDGIRLLLPRLEKLLPSERFMALERETYAALLRPMQDGRESNDVALARVQSLWRDLPKAHRDDPELVLLYVDALSRTEQQADAEKCLRHAIEQNSAPALLARYALLDFPPDQLLKHAERWYAQRSHDPELLLCLGRLSLRNSFWGKAQEYFQACEKLQSDGAASAELARLYRHLGKPDASGASFDRTLSALKLPDLPQP